jgi:hypothetical protein
LKGWTWEMIVRLDGSDWVDRMSIGRIPNVLRETRVSLYEYPYKAMPSAFSISNDVLSSRLHFLYVCKESV